jgi:hypothetical protein
LLGCWVDADGGRLMQGCRLTAGVDLTSKRGAGLSLALPPEND